MVPTKTVSQPPIANPLHEKEEYRMQLRRSLFRNGSTAGGPSNTLIHLAARFPIVIC